MIELGFSCGLSEKQKSQHAEAFVAAFEKIVFQTTIPENIINYLCETAKSSFINGAARPEKDYHYILDGHSWKWPAFEHWSNEFSKRGVWPETWHLYPLLSNNKLLENPDVVMIAEKMLASDLKKIFIKFNIAIPKKITKRDMINKAMSELSSCQIISVFPDFYESLCIKHRQNFEIWRCNLLATTISLHAHQLMRYDFGKELEADSLPGYGWIAYTLGSQCPIETEFAAKWNEGKLEGIPPFFPGDRTMVKYTKLARHMSP